MARQIPLRRRDGSVRAYALVDDADFEWLSRWRWHLRSDGYVERSIYLACRPGRSPRYQRDMLHQVILDRRGVDHINGEKLDNRRSNLRPATQAQNSQNRRVSRSAASGVRGVSRSGEYGWKATVQIAGVGHYLGYFTEIETADAAVKAFRAEHMPFSEDARLAA